MLKSFFKIIFTFVGTILLLFCIQNLVIRIPNKFVEENINKSVSLYEDKNDIQSILDNDSNFAYSLSVHYWTDCVLMGIVDNFNPKDSFNSQVYMMYYDSPGSNMCRDFIYSINNNVEANTDYSRYWHGTTIFLKILLIFTDAKGIKIISCLIIIALLLYLMYLILKESISFAIILALSLVSIMFYAVPFGFSYLASFICMLIVSIIVMKNLDKDRSYFYRLFMITGIVICFFDFLIQETLTLTLPLLLKVYFDNYKKDKINFKDEMIFIWKCFGIWIVSYLITFASKWVLASIVFGPNQETNVLSYAANRFYGVPLAWYELLGQAMLRVFNMIFPFSLFEYGFVYCLIYILFVIYSFIFKTNSQQKKVLTLLFFASFAGLLRLMVLASHTRGHDFFDYRALLPMIVWSIFVIYYSYIIPLFSKKEVVVYEKNI